MYQKNLKIGTSISVADSKVESPCLTIVECIF
jgi:hypothetical protein